MAHALSDHRLVTPADLHVGAVVIYHGESGIQETTVEEPTIGEDI